MKDKLGFVGFVGIRTKTYSYLINDVFRLKKLKQQRIV